MFEIPSDILNYFFDEIRKRGRYTVILEDNGAYIYPRSEEEHYKPIIKAKDLNRLESALKHYIESLNEFYMINNNLKDYHTLPYFFNNLLFNMASSDADDLAAYIDKRCYFFSNNHFSEYDNPQLLYLDGNVKFYIQRYLECPGLESPYVLLLTVEINGIIYNLPLVRYAFDENNVCHLFAIQFGRNRANDIVNDEYKKVVNRVNKGMNQYRNVSPSFVLTFSLFLKLLEENNISKIVVPDFLFSRYRNYYRASSEVRSNLILERILDNFIKLIQRMEIQIEGFEITSYPNEIDSYTHVNIDDLNTKNELLSRILKKTK